MRTPLPDAVARLLWDVASDDVDLDAHADYVMERVMARGDWEAMCWLRRTYPRERLADYLRRSGAGRLPPRELAYWSLVSDAGLTAQPGGGRPPWAGP